MSFDYITGTKNKDLDSLISFQPRTKEDFAELSSRIIEFIVSRHQNKPLYPSFVEHHARALAQPLKDVEVRKVASGLTTLANEKQKEQREKTSGKKKPKAGKPALGAAKVSSRCVLSSSTCSPHFICIATVILIRHTTTRPLPFSCSSTYAYLLQAGHECIRRGAGRLWQQCGRFHVALFYLSYYPLATLTACRYT